VCPGIGAFNGPNVTPCAASSPQSFNENVPLIGTPPLCKFAGARAPSRFQFSGFTHTSLPIISGSGLPPSPNVAQCMMQLVSFSAQHDQRQPLKCASHLNPHISTGSSYFSRPASLKDILSSPRNL
jgi:hypothetical protein